MSVNRPRAARRRRKQRRKERHAAALELFLAWSSKHGLGRSSKLDRLRRLVEDSFAHMAQAIVKVGEVTFSGSCINVPISVQVPRSQEALLIEVERERLDELLENGFKIDAVER